VFGEGDRCLAFTANGSGTLSSVWAESFAVELLP
jgi:hypothetical protein